MRRTFTRAALVLVVLFAAAQLVRPGRGNPPIDPARAIEAHAATPRALVAVLDRSCRDCHSNSAVSAWYTQIAPLSWLMAHEVTRGRKAINFSEWAGYAPEQQRLLLTASCDDVKRGKMPGPYTFFNQQTRLTAPDVETICAAARQAGAYAAGASR